MAPIAKDSEVQTVGSGSPTPHEAGKTQPVALEVPVSVNGARTVDGSDKREPFSETTKTVLIFANGAVIRLASTVAPGQLLFLTNENTKREVVCQVVKSKNYRSVSGYVELEFTEPAAGFWGMRFPVERPSAPSAIPQPSAPSAVSPAPKNIPPAQVGVPSSPMPVAPTPAIPASAAPVAPVSSQQVSSNASQTHAPASPVPSSSSAVTSDSETEALKREAARLQEQLSGLLFSQNNTAKTQTPAAEPKSNVIEMHRPETPKTPLPSQPSFTPPPVRTNSSTSQKSTLDLAAEEVKIPAWLEPLARNSASTPAEAPVQQTEAVRYEAPRFEAQPVHEDGTPATGAAFTESGFATEGPSPTFGGQLFSEATPEEGAPSGRSGKGFLIGLVAAGVIAAAAGGVWYFGFRHPQPAAPQQTGQPVFATLPSSERTSTLNTQAATPQTNPAANNFNSTPTGVPGSEGARLNAAQNPASVMNAGEHERIESSRAENRNVGAQPEPARKPVLGDVKLAAPTVNAQNGDGDNVAAPHLGDAPAGGDTDLNSSLLPANNNQPVAPAAVGGDVKTARLLHSVPPTYPPLARTQRIAGDVRVDALVDATGHVSTMKIVSGPVLLHQAAMDALRQWRYQPAMLDGKPVPMHLTVTVQFRLQQ